MLNVDRFEDRERASQVFLSLLDFLFRKERGSVVERQNEDYIPKAIWRTQKA